MIEKTSEITSYELEIGFIDTFKFGMVGNRLYIEGCDPYVLHYDIHYPYDVISALIDFNMPHSINEIDFNHWLNQKYKKRMSKLEYPMRYPIYLCMTEEGVRKLYKIVNNESLNFNYSHKNFIDRCETAENMRGTQNITININTSSDNRNVDFPDYNNWRNSVLNRDGKCVCCGLDKHLEAHHLFGYKENPSLAVDIDNGITLCKWCHKKYHSVYGLKDINPVDFVDFIKRFGVR